ncbi:hypothetical protein [Streptomyces malaysiensis]|uniref:Uncharacterized protein n=1 Tax=Streptomyces malaysiensis subsp. samsunensis TaxID=459658 RepID=A0A9X2LYE1_STRMQ|nr:hypothetical protein [Streptomyces samsunensis]MCQ8831771.1 hypothetical protein [Streptomyces samsunensis]
MAAGPSPSRRKNGAATAEQAAIVFDLKTQGLSYRAIEAITAAPDGPTGGQRIAASTVGELIHAEAARRVDPKVDEWRAIQIERLEGVLRDHRALRDAHWQRAMGSEDKGPEVAAALAVDRALNGMARVVEQESKVLGIHVTKIEAQVTEVTQQDLEMQEIIREAKAKVAAEEAALLRGEASE